MGGNCILLIGMVNKRKLQVFPTNKVHWGAWIQKNVGQIFKPFQWFGVLGGKYSLSR
jgi:hypothetical protein